MTLEQPGMNRRESQVEERLQALRIWQIGDKNEMRAKLKDPRVPQAEND